MLYTLGNQDVPYTPVVHVGAVIPPTLEYPDHQPPRRPRQFAIRRRTGPNGYAGPDPHRRPAHLGVFLLNVSLRVPPDLGRTRDDDDGRQHVSNALALCPPWG